MRRVLLLLIAASISGCQTSTEELFPQDGPTMVDVYNKHLNDLGRRPAGGHRPEPRTAGGDEARATGTVASYTRTAANEIDSLFPTLENPNLVMFVFPHLTSDERLPVPGYSTSFPMFERTEFALPGETAPKPVEKARPRIRILTGEGDRSAIRVF